MNIAISDTLHSLLCRRIDEEDYMRRYKTFFGELPNSCPYTITLLLFEDFLKRGYHA